MLTQYRELFHDGLAAHTSIILKGKHGSVLLEARLSAPNTLAAGFPQGVYVETRKLRAICIEGLIIVCDELVCIPGISDILVLSRSCVRRHEEVLRRTCDRLVV